MTSYNTGNPIGSKDPRDLYDNAENLDTAVNDTSRDTWTDRLGRSRKTMFGMEREFNVDQSDREARFNTFITSSGYQFLGDYAAGIEITEYNQIVRDSNGELWRVSGQVELPYTTTGAGLPEDGSFTPLGDAVLRQELANPDMGAAMVGRGVVAVESIADLLALPEGQRKEGLRYLVKGYYAGSDVGGGEFYWDATRDRGEANGGSVVDPTALGGFAGDASTRDTFLVTQGTGIGNGCFVLVSTPNQMNWGCVGDGVFDDSVPIQKAIYSRVTFIERDHFITRELVAYDSVDMSSATFVCDNQPITYLTVGKVSEVTRQKKFGIPYLRNVTGPGYVINNMAAGSVGVRFSSLYESRVVFHPSGVYGFDTGVELYSEGPGVSYTEFKDIRVINCRRHISFHTVDNGWITENLFLKLKTMNYDNFCHPDMDLSGEGVNYLHVNVSTFHAVENITFINPTLEGRLVSAHIEVVAGRGVGWCMISPRFEVPGEDFRVVGFLSNLNFINPSNSDKVTGMLGDGRWHSLGATGVVAGNAPVILGGSRGDRSRQGIGLLNENFDFSDRAPLSITPADYKDFVWNINKTGFFANGLVQNIPARPRLDINFSQQYIRWGNSQVLPVSREYAQIQSFSSLDHMAIDFTADSIRPYADDVVNLGSGNRRWSNIYSATDVITTSDGRLKQDVLPLNEAEKNVAVKIKNLIRSFRFKDSVSDKGDNARIHFGVIAQDVADAFTSEGLDPHKYGLFCYDEWEATEEELNEDGEIVTSYSEAGDRFGIRYDELLAFIISAI